MNNFFYDLNKRMAALASKQDAKQITEDAKAIAPKSRLAESMAVAERSTGDYSAKKAAAGKDIGKPGKAFSKIAKGAAERYGSKAAGERVAGAVLNKLRHPKESEMDESAFQAAIGKKKYGDQGMKALQKAGREHASAKTMSNIRNKYDKYDESQGMADEGNAFTGALAKTPKGGKFKVGNKEFTDTSSIEEGYNPVRAVKQCAKDYMEMNGIRSVHDLEAEDIESIGGDCQMNYQDVCKILGCNLPDSLGPVESYDEHGDMEEGNAFTGALAKTPKGGKFKVGNKEFTDTSSIEEGFADMDRWLAQREKEKGTGNFDRKERTLPGGMKATTYTRRHKEDDIDGDEVKSDAPKKKGRPKGKDKGPERVTAKSYKYKAGRPTKTQEDLDSDSVMMTRPSNMSSEGIEHGEQAEYNDEAGMAKDSLHTIVRHAKELERALRSNENMPEWVQEKIGQIKGMMSSVTDYIISTHERDVEQATGQEGITIEPVAERSKSQAQARMMAGAAHNPKFAKKVGVATKVAKEFNQADKGKDISKLPKKVKKTEEGAKPDFLDVDKDGNKKETFKKAVADKKEEKVDETTTSGSVAPVANAAPKSKGGMKFGQGVYESLDRQFKQALTESISVESKMAECGDGTMAPTLTIQADGEEAAKLMMLLKLAGLESQIPAACPTCGGSPCGCDEMVDENAPDWPTNTEKLDAEPNLRTYSGGLNGPKSTGQTTIPVVASQLRRQASMEESVKIERSLFKNWQQYKG